jgi:hypothetical protein
MLYAKYVLSNRAAGVIAGIAGFEPRIQVLREADTVDKKAGMPYSGIELHRQKNKKFRFWLQLKRRFHFEGAVLR